MEYGYIRVSSREQNIDRQMEAIREQSVERENIFIDRQSGKDFDRPQYKKLLRKIKKNDVIIVKSIDRLGRNYSEILEQWRVITKVKGADIFIIDFPLLDTRNKSNDLTGTLIADIVLQLLSYVAQTEREFIHQRQAEGIACAKQKGIKFGRPSIELPHDFSEIAADYISKRITLTRAAEKSGMSKTTFYRRLNEYYDNE